MQLRSPLLLQRQRGVNAARLEFKAAGGWRQGRERRPQDLLGPTLLPEVLVTLWRRQLVAEGDVEKPLVFGRTLAAVKLCCGRRETIKEEDECKSDFAVSVFLSRLPGRLVNKNKPAECLMFLA